jgi:protocatechuate 3,4-dioxygenase beta subunit
MKINSQCILKFALTTFLSLNAQAGSRACTNPDDGLGPYYPPKPMGLPFYGAEPLAGHELATNDLRLNPLSGAQSQRKEMTELSGAIVDQDGAPLAGALIELWNTAPSGSYSVERNAKNLDPGFFGYGKTMSDSNGDFEFKTLYPSSYTRYGFLIRRPPHFHFRISHANIKTIGLEMDVVPESQKIGHCENKLYLLKNEQGHFKGKFQITIQRLQN